MINPLCACTRCWPPGWGSGEKTKERCISHQCFCCYRDHEEERDAEDMRVPLFIYNDKEVQS